MTTALVPTTPQPVDMKVYLSTVTSVAGLKAQKDLMAAYDRAVEALIGPGDVQREGDREFKKKSAWAKLARHFQIDTEIVRYHGAVNPDDEGHYYAEVVVRGRAPWGQVAEALGACSTREPKYGRASARAKAHHDCLATAATRARNRAIADLIAQGEVSAEEIESRDEIEERVETPRAVSSEAMMTQEQRDTLIELSRDVSLSREQRGWVAKALTNTPGPTQDQAAKAIVQLQFHIAANAAHTDESGDEPQ